MVVNRPKFNIGRMAGVPHLPLYSIRFRSFRTTLRRALPLLEAALARFKFFLPVAEKPFCLTPTKPKETRHYIPSFFWWRWRELNPRPKHIHHSIVHKISSLKYRQPYNEQLNYRVIYEYRLQQVYRPQQAQLLNKTADPVSKRSPGLCFT